MVRFLAWTFLFCGLLVGLAVPAATTPPRCHLVPLEAVGDCREAPGAASPLRLVSGYANYSFDLLKTFNGDGWNRGELSFGAQFISQVCRPFQRGEMGNGAPARCEGQWVPRGSPVRFLGSQGAIAFVQIIGVTQKYPGLSRDYQARLVAAGDRGFMPLEALRAPVPNQLFFLQPDDAAVASPVRLSENGATVRECRDGSALLSLEVLGDRSPQVSHSAFLDLNCRFETGALDTGPTVPRAYNLLRLLNGTFHQLKDPFQIQDLVWNEEGLVRLPYSPRPYQEDVLEEAIQQKLWKISYIEGFGPENRYVTFNESARERYRQVDRWAHPRAMCSLFKTMEQWAVLCAGKLRDPLYCTLQLNDFAFHSPTVTLGNRSVKGLSRDPTGHMTHGSGNCVDMRLISPEKFGAGAIGGAGVDVLTNDFLELVIENSGTDMFFARPNAATRALVRPISHHADHTHFCFADLAAYRRGEYQSDVMPYPLLSVNTGGKNHDCYTEDLE